MAYIFNPTPLRQNVYEAEWQAIQADCEQRYNEANNYLPEPYNGYYAEQVWQAEAERIFRRKFGVSVGKAVYGGDHYCFGENCI